MIVSGETWRKTRKGRFLSARCHLERDRDRETHREIHRERQGELERGRGGGGERKEEVMRERKGSKHSVYGHGLSKLISF